jgi:hypothetical protein
MRPLYQNDILRLSKPTTKVFGDYVYFLIYDNEIVYVGKSNNPHTRMNLHINKFTFDRYYTIKCNNPQESEDLEKYYIKSIKPKYNITHNDDYIRPIKKEIKETLNPTFELYVGKEKINILNNTYIKKNGIYYFRINNELLINKIDAPIYEYNGRLYNRPTKSIGNVDDLFRPK